MAMARNRDVTIGYIKDSLIQYDSDYLNFSKLDNFDLFNNSRLSMEKSRDYISMINEGSIAQVTMDKIKAEGGMHMRDAYNLLRTFNPNKVFTADMVIDGETTNRLFRKFGVDAFQIDGGYVILDNDAIMSFRDGEVTDMDTDAKNNYKLSQKNSKWNDHKVDLDSTPKDVQFHKEPIQFRDIVGKHYASKMVSRSILY